MGYASALSPFLALCSAAFFSRRRLTLCLLPCTVPLGGHTGIVTKVCSKTTFSMVAMGLHGAGLANCLTNAGIAKWGSGGFLGYWTPH